VGPQRRRVGEFRLDRLRFPVEVPFDEVALGVPVPNEHGLPVRIQPRTPGAPAHLVDLQRREPLHPRPRVPLLVADHDPPRGDIDAGGQRRCRADTGDLTVAERFLDDRPVAGPESGVVERDAGPQAVG